MQFVFGFILFDIVTPSSPDSIKYGIFVNVVFFLAGACVFVFFVSYFLGVYIKGKNR